MRFRYSKLDIRSFLTLMLVLSAVIFFVVSIEVISIETHSPEVIMECRPVTTEEPTEVVTEPILIEEVSSEPIAVIESTEAEVIEVETISEATEFVSYYSYTEEELDLLARLIYSEAGSESYDTKLKVGSVVMNRVEDSNFPNTIRDVIYQKGQFSVTVVRLNGVIMIDRPADEESFNAAKEILDYGSVLPETVQVFYASHCREPWVRSRKVYTRSDNVIFSHIHR